MSDVGCLMLVVYKVQCTKNEVPQTPDVGREEADMGCEIWDVSQEQKVKNKKSKAKKIPWTSLERTSLTTHASPLTTHQLTN